MSGHNHSHGGGAGRLRLAATVVISLAALELVVGRISGSLALMSDAGHLVTDAGTLALSWYGVNRARRPATARHTYGYHRSGIVIAGVNAALLLGVAVSIAANAIDRLHHPTAISAGPVIAVAAAALFFNGGLTLLLSRGSHDLSTRSAMLHVASDAVASLGVMAAAVIVLFTGWLEADAVVSLGIAALITLGAAALLREALAILNESVPGDIDADSVRACIAAAPGVEDVHDLHIWSLDRAHRALSAHVTVADRPLAEVTVMLRNLERTLCNDFAIEHATLQPECPSCVSEAPVYCDLDERHAVHAEVSAAPRQ